MTRRFASLILIIGSILICAEKTKAIDETESLALLVQTLDKTEDSAIRISLMRGMLSGMAGRRDVRAPTSWKQVSARLSESDNNSVRDLTLQLSQVFGDAEATRRALALVSDRSANAHTRLTALRALLTQQNAQVSELLEPLLDEPEFRLDAIRGFAAIENAKAPEILLGRYGDWDPSDRKAVIETLATRKNYAQALLAAIKNKKVSRDQVPAHVARSLSNILGESFVKVFGDVRQLDQDRAKQMAKYKKMLTDKAVAKADASRGRAVFQKTCASCHLLYGTGAKIGPDLTGSNRANLDYILLNSVDPSYDVPDGYKMTLVQTVDGRLINGVIAEENSQRVILKTVEQPMLVVLKDDIESRKISPKSMMPDGQLDQLKPQQVMDLIKYLRTTEQVEMAE